jgi:hypothetical protein
MLLETYQSKDTNKGFKPQPGEAVEARQPGYLGEGENL